MRKASRWLCPNETNKSFPSNRRVSIHHRVTHQDRIGRYGTSSPEICSTDNNDEKEIPGDLLDPNMISVPTVSLQIGAALENLHPWEEDEMIDTGLTGSLDYLRERKSLIFKMRMQTFVFNHLNSFQHCIEEFGTRLWILSASWALHCAIRMIHFNHPCMLSYYQLTYILSANITPTLAVESDCTPNTTRINQ